MYTVQEAGKKLAGDMKAMFLETSAKDNQCASDIFIKSLIQIEKVKIKFIIFISHGNIWGFKNQ